MRELISNALDAMLEPNEQIGNFGMGFFTLLSVFFTEHLDRIEILTHYAKGKDKQPYRITIRQGDSKIPEITWDNPKPNSNTDTSKNTL